MNEAASDRIPTQTSEAGFAESGVGAVVGRSRDALAALAIFALFVAFFLSVMAREALWGDSAKLSIYVLENDFGARGITTGMGHHTFTVIAGRLVADVLGLEPQRALAVVSVLSGAGATALLFLLLRGYGVSGATSLFCATALAMAHMNLFAFTIQESYAPMLVLWVGILVCFRSLRERPGRGASLVCGALVGMSLLNHSLAVMLFTFVLLPSLVIRHGWRRSIEPAVYGAAGFLLVFVPVNWLLMVSKPSTTTFTAGLVDNFRRWMDVATLPKGLVFFVLWVGFQLPVVALLMVGKARGLKLSAGRTVDWRPHLGVIVFTALFTSAYIIQRRMLMMTVCLPSFLVLAAPVIDSFGLTGAKLRRLSVAMVAFNLALYLGTSMAIGAVISKVVPELRVNHWRPAAYYFRPFMHLWAPPSAMLRELDERFPPMGDSGRKYLFIIDFTFKRPVDYAQRQNGWRPDIEVFEMDRWLYLPDVPLERHAEQLVRQATAEGKEIVVVPYPDRLMRTLKLETFADLETSGDCAVVRLRPAATAAPTP